MTGWVGGVLAVGGFIVGWGLYEISAEVRFRRELRRHNKEAR